MNRFLSLIRRLFRPAPVVVNTYSVRRTDLQQRRDLKHAELAREVGFAWKGRLNG